jgi:putative ABC transport system substrate-binding protein
MSMTRRDLIALLGSTAVSWPLGVRAQQQERMRRIGVLTGLAETHSPAIEYLEELRDRLQQLGWTESRNAQFVYRYAAGDPALARACKRTCRHAA